MFILKVCLLPNRDMKAEKGCRAKKYLTNFLNSFLFKIEIYLFEIALIISLTA